MTRDAIHECSECGHAIKCDGRADHLAELNTLRAERDKYQARCNEKIRWAVEAEDRAEAAEARALAAEKERDAWKNRHKTLSELNRHNVAHAKDEAKKLRATATQLRAALERLLGNAERIFNKQPVRDWGETLAEARQALSQVEPASTPDTPNTDHLSHQGRVEPCPFCDYAGPSRIVASSDKTYTIEPLNPVVPGHLLVIPRVHVEDFVTEPVVFADVAADAARVVQEFGEADAYNLITSKGEAATQTVKHLHVHLVPRHPADGLSLPWLEQKVKPATCPKCLGEPDGWWCESCKNTGRVG